MTERVSLGTVDGTWMQTVESVNAMIDDLVRPTTEISRVIQSVARGDLSQKMALTIEGQPVKGEFAAIGNTVNEMVDQLGSFADEVTRVAREVGTDGKLGGQAQVKGVSGTWRDLTENVNSMASNLTDQVRQIAAVTTAVANGDLSQKITVTARGEILELKDTINTMVDQLSSFGDEVTRVAREVGTEGQLGGQAEVKGVSGTWRDLTENVNFMASNLTDQVRQIAAVTTAVAQGDLTQKVTVEAKGEVATLAETINSMTDTLRVFAEQVTAVAREVGTEGVLGGQAEVSGVAGTWKDLTDSVNTMASNLTDQVRQIAVVTTAVANGDLSQKVTVEAKGEVATLAETINSMTDRLRVFAEQVTGVAREVGTEGQLGGQAEVEGVSGTWRDLTDSVNLMANNLTGQVRNIAQVTTAVANGDLSQKITVDARGEINELKGTINTMVDQLSSFADEVTRVAREVGTEGRLGGQAEVKDVSGTWRDLTESVNFLASNLTDQVRNIAQVTTAVATGDLSQKIDVDAQGEILELKQTINTMVDQLQSFADEVTRVAREVGTEGKLGGQAKVEGVSGTWRDLTQNVNQLADNLTDQVRNIAQVTTAVATGDLSKKITVDAQGEIAELKETINTMVDQLRSFAAEVTRVAREVGTEGKLGGQATVEGVSGTWRGLTDNVNLMAGNLTSQVRAIARVTTAVANGDLSKKIDIEAKGEILELSDTINTMVDQLSSFADEVTRVAREVGTEGVLGGQAEVKGVSGTWRDLTENVNFMASNLTDQVRNIAQVATAVANGDLSQKITVDARGEILELKKTLNTMVDQLSSFAARGHARRARGRHAGPARRSGGGRRRQRHVARPDAERQPARREPHDAGARDRRGLDGGDPGRPHAPDRRRGPGRGRRALGHDQPDDREPARDDRQEPQAGLAEHEPRAHLRPDAGPARPRDGVAPDHVGDLAARGGAARRVLPHRGRQRRRARAAPDRQLRLQAAQVGLQPVQVRRGARRPGGARGHEHPHLRRAAGLHQGHVGSRRRAAGEHRRDADPVRGAGARGRRARVAARVHRRLPGVPRAARRDARRRAERDHRQPPHGGAARAVAVARRGAAVPVGGAAVPAGGAQALQRRARAADVVAARIRGAAADPAGGAAADQRGAAGEGRAAQPPEPRHRDPERGDRARAARSRGEGRAAVGQLEVQVGVPREHEPRAAHAAQQPADPVQAAGREPRAEPHAAADQVRHDDPHLRRRPVVGDLRHPRPVEDRGRQDGDQRRDDRARDALRVRRARVRLGRRGEGPGAEGHDRARRAGRRSSPTSSACSRCCATS